jgi:nucleotide-binding universal stress UspA family protein
MDPIKHILFPFDFSARSTQVAPFVRALAERVDAKVTLLSVVPPAGELPPERMRPPAGDTPPQMARALQDHLDRALVDELAGVPVARVTDAGDPAFRIAAFAGAHAVDLIMMPTHGHGLFRNLLIGSVTAKVLHDAICPVWTAAHAEAQRARALPRTVLCAVDGGSHSPALLKWAGEFCQRVGAQLTVLHVVGSVTDWPALERERRLQDEVRDAARAKMEKMLQDCGIAAPLRIAVGEVVNTVTEDARQESADLVIVGRGSIAEPFGRLRTHAFAIVQRSPCPVLSV